MLQSTGRRKGPFKQQANGGLSRRGFVAAGLSAALLSGCGKSSTKVLRAAEILPANFPTSKAVVEMGRLIEQKSGGKLAIKLYAGAQLGSERDTLELATFGGVDINRTALAPVNSIEPLTAIPALPFVFNNVPHMRAAMDGEPGKKVLASLEKHGLIGLCFYDSGARSFYNTKKPILTPDDMRGMKLRVQNSDLYVSLVEALGANPTPMPLGEVYQSLLQGVIDGAENNWPSYYDGRHFEVAKYYSLTRHVIAPEILVMSAQSWRGLSAKEREIVIESARQSVPYMRTLWDAETTKAEKAIRDAKVAVNEIEDKAAFVDAMQPVWKEFVTDKEQEKLVAEIREMGADFA